MFIYASLLPVETVFDLPLLLFVLRNTHLTAFVRINGSVDQADEILVKTLEQLVIRLGSSCLLLNPSCFQVDSFTLTQFCRDFWSN